MRRWLTRFLWCGWGLLVLLLLAAHSLGQRSLWTTLLVFGPVSWWTLCALLIGGVAFKLDRRLTCLSFITAFIIAGPLWEYRTHHPLILKDAKPCLRVLTCNRGQHYGHTLADFIAKEQPDVLAFQESNDPGAYVPDAPEYAAYPHRSRISEFQFLSRYPITSAQICVGPTVMIDRKIQPAHKAARFELQTPLGQVVVYDVHMLSPRFELRSYKNARIADEAERVRLERFEGDQWALLDETMKMIESETLPTVVCGDFNAPSLGPMYRRMITKFQDSHRQAGIGYGFSFPGDITKPFTGGQWIRIDYVLASRAWDVLRCDVEQQMGSQHSAVISTLRLR